jgi:hypothetical protein
MKIDENPKNISETEETVLKVQFATDLLIVTFLKDAHFQGRRLAIKGEALSWGFDAYPSSMRWGKPYEDEEIDEETKSWIVNKILERKSPTDFKIIMREG